MKTRSMIQLMILLVVFISHSAQQQNPICQPIDTNKAYEKTLLVFVVDSNPNPRIDNAMKYVMKQFACTIPETENIKSYLMDYTNETILPTVKEEDFSTSKDFIGKIESSLTGSSSAVDKCTRLTKFRNSFSTQDAVKKFKEKVKYVSFMDNCQAPSDDWVLLKFMFVDNVFWYKQDSEHFIAFNPTDANVAQFLKDDANKIIGKFLEDDSMWQTPAPGSSSSNSEAGDSSIIIILSVVIGVLLLTIVGLIVLVIAICKHKNEKKKKKNKKGSEYSNNTESKNSCNKSQSAPLLPKNPPKIGEGANKIGKGKNEVKEEKITKEKKEVSKDETQKLEKSAEDTPSQKKAQDDLNNLGNKKKDAEYDNPKTNMDSSYDPTVNTTGDS